MKKLYSSFCSLFLNFDYERPIRTVTSLHWVGCQPGVIRHLKDTILSNSIFLILVYYSGLFFKKLYISCWYSITCFIRSLIIKGLLLRILAIFLGESWRSCYLYKLHYVTDIRYYYLSISYLKMSFAEFLC